MNPEKGLQLEGLVAKLCDLARCSPRTSYIKALCEESDQAITTLEAERDEAREQAADAKSTLSAWFDLAKKIEADALPTLADGFKGYLRTSMNGGMPTKMADAAKNAFAEYCRLYAGRDLVPVLRGMSEAALQASEARVKGLEERQTIVPVWPTIGEIQKAGWAWRNDKDRETDSCDQMYFANNWHALPGLGAYVTAEIKKRPEFAQAALTSGGEGLSSSVAGLPAHVADATATDTHNHTGKED